MNKFSELDIKVEDDRTIFDCRQVSITDIVNCEVVILGYIKDVKTRHGENRYLVHIENYGIESKFFSNSKHIKNTLDAIPEAAFPFSTTIKTVNCGVNKYYKLT